MLHQTVYWQNNFITLSVLQHSGTVQYIAVTRLIFCFLYDILSCYHSVYNYMEWSLLSNSDATSLISLSVSKFEMVENSDQWEQSNH
jgi:hypothetical protein